MANVLTSVRTHAAAETALAPRRPATMKQQQLKASTGQQKTAAAPLASNAVNAPAAVTAPTTEKADFRALFTGQVYPAAPEPPAPKPNPTAESIFGTNVWHANPTGIAPNGQQYSYNPFYFATKETALKVAEMAGGEVVESNVFTPTHGMFSQNQPNYMVKMPDGRLINPGLVASFYTHGYPQSYIDRLLAVEFNS